MKITKLHLKKFKVFDDLELDFTGKDKKPLNQIVLAGLNGTGKSTILEAIKGKFIERSELFDNVKSQKKRNYSSNLFDSKIDIKLGEYQGNGNENRKLTYRERIVYKPSRIRNPRLANQYSNFESALISVNEISYETVYDYPSYQFFRNKKLSEIDKESKLEIILKPIKNKIFENKEIPPKQVIENEIANMNSIFRGIDLNSRFVDIDDDNLFFESANGQRITFDELALC